MRGPPFLNLTASCLPTTWKNMATVTVQVGQCGNQIGTQLFSVLHSDANVSYSQGHFSYHQETMSRFFSVDLNPKKQPSAKAVLVDMEPKAIQGSLTEAQRTGTWMYDSSCVYSGSRGSGNNWANGFYCHGPKAAAQISNIVQKQVEKCDSFEGFLILMSVAGGTGSGMGAYVTELLRDHYPKAVLVNPVVWPYATGEVIVQNYNALLTTSHLSSSSDAIIPVLNDHLHHIGSKCLRLKEVSFNDLNKIASHAIASVLQPATPLCDTPPVKNPHKLLYRQCSLSSLCTQLTPHPSYRFLSIKTVPQIPDKSHIYTADLWNGLLKRLKQMLLTNSPIDEALDWSTKPHPQSIKSIANLLILRGKGDVNIEKLLADNELYCPWVPKSDRYTSWVSNALFNKYEKCCSLVSNNSTCHLPLSVVAEKAWHMYCSKAYIHQYQRFGLSEEHFMESFVIAEQILRDYSTLT